ncbi:putative protein kinase UbiB [Arthrobacter ulcerisalmonis]|uniref:Protein kinase domain-containing protein n=1 Tax=Arthrobacter ulcerisalmonis TaxID=2483813 RepID=A0A3P5WQ97_9MICC|nr:AarF/UbiB family protein [Arthrobacter ulcerisalmonis]VDC23888.1 putative protein kinase UbiB [Arthrobacter ulcerisalmonis]
MDPGRIILVTGMIGLLALIMMLLALLSRRILGVRIGAMRTLMALIVAVGAEYLFESQILWQTPDRGLAYVSIQFGIALFTAFLFLVVAELVVPRGVLPPPHTWLASLRAGSQRGIRYSQILRIGAKHGLLPLRSSNDPEVNADRARSLRLALEEAGATFVKFGQMLSTRPDLLPPEYITELSRLQQHVTPVSWDLVRQILEEDAGRPVAEVFADFDETPLAAASIGQVHRATLHDGSRVAVKVQRPNIRRKVALDLDIAVRIGKMLENSTAFGGSLGTEALARGFAENLREELDYEQEARNIIALRTAVAKHPDEVRVVIPFHVPELCTSRVLVMEMLDGRTFSDPVTASSMGAESRKTYATQLTRSLLRQIMIDGTFHADPHPGNIIVLADGRLGLVDFGSVGRLDHELRTSIQQVVLAIDRADAGLLVNALFEVVIRPDEIDVPVLKRTLSQFMGTSLQPGVPLDLKAINELIRILARFDLAIPPALAGAFRAIATIEGTLTSLAPGFDIVAEARTFAGAQIGEHFTPGGIKETVQRELLDTLPILRRMPRHIDQLAAALQEGHLSVNVRLLADRRDREVLTRMLGQALLTLIAGVLGIMGVILLAFGQSAEVAPGLPLFHVIGYNLAGIAAVLMLRVLYLVFNTRTKPTGNPKTL